MAKNPQRFRGLLTNVDAKDVGPGHMVVQRNIGNYRPGRLDVRKGLAYLSDSTIWNLTISGTADCLGVFAYIAAQADWLVMQMTDGDIKAVRNSATLNDIVTGLNTFMPVCFCRDQYGALLWVNGIERGSRWKGITATPDELGVFSPEDIYGANAPPRIEETGNNGNPKNSVTYYCAYRYVDFDGIPSSISQITAFAVSATGTGRELQWVRALTSGQQVIPSTQSRVQYVEFWRSVANDKRILYRVGRSTNTAWAAATSFIDDVSDETLLNNDADLVLPVFNQDLTPNARRFNRPPTCKPFMALHQDVMFYYGRVFYNTGTIGLTNGNTAGTSSGASLRTEMNGWKLRVVGDTAEHTVSAINEGTGGFTIDSNYAGSTGTGKSYVLTPDPQDEAYVLRFSVKGEPESVPEVYAQRVQSSSAATDVETGMMPYGPYLFLFHERSMYQCTFSTNPLFDLVISPMMNRGLVNNRCAIVAGSSGLWCLDQQGVYRTTGGVPNDETSITLKDLFTDGTIDWTASKKKWYFASYEERQHVVRFHVAYTGDGTTYPTRALCRNIDTGEWWEEQYPVELSGACNIAVSGNQRLICGGPDDKAALMFEGYTDPSSASVSWTMKTTCFEIDQPQQNTKAVGIQVPRELRIQHLPTTALLTMTLKLYKNRGASAVSRIMGLKDPSGLLTYEPNSSSITIPLDATRAGTADPGFTNVPLDEGVSDKGIGDRFLQVELSGSANTEQVTITALDMQGYG